MIIALVSSHYIGCSTLRVTNTKSHKRFNVLSSTLMLIDKIEIVAKQNSMFFNVSGSQI